MENDNFVGLFNIKVSDKIPLNKAPAISFGISTPCSLYNS